ncbi:MAG: hypothetical protein HRT90_11410, partial [Candidatus Margulisbacteria bacterium]|nr:hypothetical protein [Candidatus Margulisiibacteriota bacterium]
KSLPSIIFMALYGQMFGSMIHSALHGLRENRAKQDYDRNIQSFLDRNNNDDIFKNAYKGTDGDGLVIDFGGRSSIGFNYRAVDMAAFAQANIDIGHEWLRQYFFLKAAQIYADAISNAAEQMGNTGNMSSGLSAVFQYLQFHKSISEGILDDFLGQGSLYTQTHTQRQQDRQVAFITGVQLIVFVLFRDILYNKLKMKRATHFSDYNTKIQAQDKANDQPNKKTRYLNWLSEFQFRDGQFAKMRRASRSFYLVFNWMAFSLVNIVQMILHGKRAEDLRGDAGDKRDQANDSGHGAKGSQGILDTAMKRKATLQIEEGILEKIGEHESTFQSQLYGMVFTLQQAANQYIQEKPSGEAQFDKFEDRALRMAAEKKTQGIYKAAFEAYGKLARTIADTRRNTYHVTLGQLTDNVRRIVLFRLGAEKLMAYDHLVFKLKKEGAELQQHLDDIAAMKGESRIEGFEKDLTFEEIEQLSTQVERILNLVERIQNIIQYVDAAPIIDLNVGDAVNPKAVASFEQLRINVRVVLGTMMFSLMMLEDDVPDMLPVIQRYKRMNTEGSQISDEVDMISLRDHFSHLDRNDENEGHTHFSFLNHFGVTTPSTRNKILDFERRVKEYLIAARVDGPDEAKRDFPIDKESKIFEDVLEKLKKPENGVINKTGRVTRYDERIIERVVRKAAEDTFEPTIKISALVLALKNDNIMSERGVVLFIPDERELRTLLESKFDISKDISRHVTSLVYHVLKEARQNSENVNFRAVNFLSEEIRRASRLGRNGSYAVGNVLRRFFLGTTSNVRLLTPIQLSLAINRIVTKEKSSGKRSKVSPKDLERLMLQEFGPDAKDLHIDYVQLTDKIGWGQDISVQELQKCNIGNSSVGHDDMQLLLEKKYISETGEILGKRGPGLNQVWLPSGKELMPKKPEESEKDIDDREEEKQDAIVDTSSPDHSIGQYQKLARLLKMDRAKTGKLGCYMYATDISLSREAAAFFIKQHHFVGTSAFPGIKKCRDSTQILEDLEVLHQVSAQVFKKPTLLQRWLSPGTHSDLKGTFRANMTDFPGVDEKESIDELWKTTIEDFFSRSLTHHADTNTPMEKWSRLKEIAFSDRPYHIDPLTSERVLTKPDLSFKRYWFKKQTLQGRREKIDELQFEAIQMVKKTPEEISDVDKAVSMVISLTYMDIVEMGVATFQKRIEAIKSLLKEDPSKQEFVRKIKEYVKNRGGNTFLQGGILGDSLKTVMLRLGIEEGMDTPRKDRAKSDPVVVKNPEGLLSILHLARSDEEKAACLVRYMSSPVQRTKLTLADCNRIVRRVDLGDYFSDQVISLIKKEERLFFKDKMICGFKLGRLVGFEEVSTQDFPTQLENYCPSLKPYIRDILVNLFNNKEGISFLSIREAVSSELRVTGEMLYRKLKEENIIRDDDRLDGDACKKLDKLKAPSKTPKGPEDQVDSDRSFIWDKYREGIQQDIRKNCFKKRMRTTDFVGLVVGTNMTSEGIYDELKKVGVLNKDGWVLRLAEINELRPEHEKLIYNINDLLTQKGQHTAMDDFIHGVMSHPRLEEECHSLIRRYARMRFADRRIINDKVNQERIHGYHSFDAFIAQYMLRLLKSGAQYNAGGLRSRRLWNNRFQEFVNMLGGIVGISRDLPLVVSQKD